MDNKPISTRTHGMIDYMTAALSFFAPEIFGFLDLSGPAVMIPKMVGLMIFGLTIFTDHELGLFKVIPMKLHLMVDIFTSIFLAASPFLFGFIDERPNVWLPHLAVGVSYLIISLMTQERPETARA
jgi:hypothetical protein